MGDRHRGAERCTAVAGIATVGSNIAMFGRTVYQNSQNRHADANKFSHLVYPLSQAVVLAHTVDPHRQIRHAKQLCAAAWLPAQPNRHAKRAVFGDAMFHRTKTGVPDSHIQQHCLQNAPTQACPAAVCSPFF